SRALLFLGALALPLVLMVWVLRSVQLALYQGGASISLRLVETLRDTLARLFNRRHGPGATAKRVDLREASLSRAKLTYRSLAAADLRGANLIGADLAFAVMLQADLTGASLDGANVSSADLSRACITSVERLRTMILDSQTKLAEVAWLETPRLTPDDAKPRIERVAAQRDRSRVYRTIALDLRRLGLYTQAGFYRLQEQRAERHALRIEGKPLRFMGSWLLDAVC